MFINYDMSNVPLNTFHLILHLKTYSKKKKNASLNKIHDLVFFVFLRNWYAIPETLKFFKLCKKNKNEKHFLFLYSTCYIIIDFS